MNAHQIEGLPREWGTMFRSENIETGRTGTYENLSAALHAVVGPERAQGAPALETVAELPADFTTQGLGVARDVRTRLFMVTKVDSVSMGTDRLLLVYGNSRSIPSLVSTASALSIRDRAQESGVHPAHELLGKFIVVGDLRGSGSQGDANQMWIIGRGSYAYDFRNVFRMLTYYRTAEDADIRYDNLLKTKYNDFVKDVIDGKVPEANHGIYRFVRLDKSWEIWFDQYCLSVPKKAAEKVVKPLFDLADDKKKTIRELLALCEGSQVLLNGIALTYSVNNNFHYVCGVRVNLEDVDRALTSIVRYSTLEKYKEFLHDVNRVPFKLRDVIDSGMQFTFAANLNQQTISRLTKKGEKLFDEFDQGSLNSSESTGFSYFAQQPNTVTMRCAVRRVGRKMPEIEMFGDWRRISKLDNLLTMSKDRNNRASRTLLLEGDTLETGEQNVLQRVFQIDGCLHDEDAVINTNVLSAPTSGSQTEDRKVLRIDNKSKKVVSNIMDTLLSGIASQLSTATDAVAKSKDLLFATVTEHGVRTLTNDKKKITGFIVTGQTGNQYRLQLNGGVFRYLIRGESKPTMQGEYICIDPATGHGKSQAVGFDYVVSVMMALICDRDSSDVIFTLKQYVEAAAKADRK